MRGSGTSRAALGTLNRLRFLAARNSAYRHRAYRWQNDTNAAEVSLWLDFKLQ